MTFPASTLIAILAGAQPISPLFRMPATHQREVLALAERERLLPFLGMLVIAEGLAVRQPESLVQALAERHAHPREIPDRLAFEYELTRQRNLDLAQQLERVGAQLNIARIPWMALKGAALLSHHVWPDPATRSTIDLDILIPVAEDVDRAAHMLQQRLGYQFTPDDPANPGSPVPDEHQLPALILPDHRGSVEIHRAFMPDEHLRHFPTDHALDTAVSVAGSERALRADQMIRHIVAHARISDWTIRKAELALRSVLDVGYLLTRSPELTGSLHQAEDSPELRRAIDLHLVAVNELFSTGIDLPWRARLQWRWMKYVAGNSRRAWFWKHLSMMPVYMGAERMHSRVSSQASLLRRFSETAVHILHRTRRAWAQRPDR